MSNRPSPAQIAAEMAFLSQTRRAHDQGDNDTGVRICGHVDPDGKHCRRLTLQHRCQEHRRDGAA